MSFTLRTNVNQSNVDLGKIHVITKKGVRMYKEDNFNKIHWIKNVKQVIHGDWAYENKEHVNCSDVFQLHWSSKKGGSAKRANIGDIIVLFQKPYSINGKGNDEVYLTHLVTPISKEVVINNDFPEHKFCRAVRLVAMAEPINTIPVSDKFNFKKVGRGLTNSIEHLISRENLNEKEIKMKIWDIFREYLCDKNKKNK